MQVALFYEGEEISDPLYSRIDVADSSLPQQVVFPSLKRPCLFDEVRIFDDEGDYVSSQDIDVLFDVVVQIRINI